MRKQSHLYAPILYVMAACGLSLSIAAAFFNVWLALISFCVSAICLGLVAWQIRHIKKSINHVLLEIGKTLTDAQKDVLEAFPVPVFICAENGEVLWCNPLAQTNVLGEESAYLKDIREVLGSNVDITRKCPKDGYAVQYQGRHFAVFTTPTASEDSGLYAAYFYETTELEHYKHEYFAIRPSILLILIDNYEELLQGMKENERTRILGEIEYAISNYFSENGGLMLKTERDRFTVVIDERHLKRIVSSRFPILEEIRKVQTQNQLSPTLSIGVGRDSAQISESEEYARQALDMALGRGGDQAAVRTGTGYEFFGGVSGGVEKRAKVKTRIVATALRELIATSDNVLLMGHRLADLDCFGASFGLLGAIRQMGKQAHIVIRKDKNLVDLLLNRLNEAGYGELIIEPEQALQMVRAKTLLIISDVHVAHLLESPEIYEACKQVVVVDHHRKMVNHIDKATIFYHEPYASSASEMVTELTQYFGDKCHVTRPEAEALLAGIMLDTKNFVIRTGVRTFEAAAYLRRAGADTVEVRRLFASSMEAYQRKTQLVSGAYIYKGCAIAVSDEVDVPNIQMTAAQAADELLGIEGVLASFLIFEQNGEACLSARSMGGLNVQLIMERMGGGGHHTMAGAQIKGITAKQAHEQLVAAIDAVMSEQNGRAGAAAQDNIIETEG